MSGVKIEGDWSKFEQHLNKMINLNFTSIHEEIGEALVSSTQKRFEDEKSPDGKSWEKSIRAKEESGQTLTDSSRLKTSITYKAKPEGVAVGTNVRYASVHQEGMTIKAKGKFLKFAVGKGFAQVKQVKIPARPFIGISSDDQTEIKAIVTQHIKEALK